MTLIYALAVVAEKLDLGNLPNILSGVLVVVAVAAAAWGALNRETLKTVRESNKDLLERVDILEKAELRHNAEIAKLTSENETLRSVVTGEATLVAIDGRIAAHHKAAEDWWEKMDGQVAALVQVLTEGKSPP